MGTTTMFQEDAPPADLDAGERIDLQLARAEFAGREIARATARQLAAIRNTIREARDFPEVFVGPGSDADPQRARFAERAAIAEVATGLGIAPNTVRNRLGEAELLITRLPGIWAGFAEGEISYPNVRVILDVGSNLPADESVWAEYDEKLEGAAAAVNPGRMRILARSLAEKLAPEPLDARHERARRDRRVWLEPAADGMAWLGSLQPADAAYRAYARISANAKQLAAAPGETRSMAQLRADVLADLLTGDGTEHEVKTTVSVTVPVLSLLQPDATEPCPRSRPGPESGTLNGYGPINADTARRLAGKAPSFFRLLVHPVTSAILDVDRTSYAVPADLKRWIRAAHTYCVFPGCNKPAVDCDLDHSTDWAFGGATSAANVAPVCRDQHRLKHHSLWQIIRNTDGNIQWKSPRGRIHNADPPPF